MPSNDSTITRALRVISVKKLFGVFDHHVELKEDRITIIHGPNGFGKTAILRLVSGFFERHYSMLRNVPFESVTFQLDDQTSVSVKQVPQTKTGKKIKPGLKISSLDKEWDWHERKDPRLEIPRHFFDERIPWLHHVDDDTWLDTQTGESLDVAEITDRYSEYLPISNRPDKTPEWLVQIQDSVQVYFIRANRLESPTMPERLKSARRRPFVSAPAVAAYAIDLAERIQRVQSEYAKLSQTLDRSFPVRIMSASRDSGISLENVRNQLAALDQQRKELNSAGLLEPSPQEGLDQFPEPDESQLSVLAVYIDDIKKKLGVFKDLRERIELFRELLNRRFHYKDVRIDRGQGFGFQTDSGQDLPATSLSTGEQHEVVILYQLLFLTQPDSLILIDEPEISLHVAWQEPFLKDLSRIAELSKLDFVIATHSPQIIDNRWDLTVELKGPRR